MDGTRNSIARTAAQIRTNLWRSATYLKRIRKRLLRFLELSGLGRTVEGGLDVVEACAARMDEWVIWETEEERAGRGE
jgi:hypothetical protein